MDIVKRSKDIAQETDKPFGGIARTLGIFHRGFHHIKDSRVGSAHCAPRPIPMTRRDQIIALQKNALLVIGIIFALDPMQFAMEIEKTEIIGDEGLFDPAVMEDDLVGRVRLQIDQGAHDRVIG